MSAMAEDDVESGLSPEALEIRSVAHRFAEEVLRPTGLELDKLADPAEVTAEGSPFWMVHERFCELGINDPEALDGLDPGEAVLLRAIITEELGWGDGGLAVSLGAAGFHRHFIPMTDDPELTERYMTPASTDIGCWAITEPDHGSDTLAFSEPHFTDPAVRADCVARRDGDDYVINGQKAAWVSNGTIATVAALFCTIDRDLGMAGGGVCIVPLDLPGVARGRPLDKIGQRPLPQGEIHFDDVRIPARWMVIDEALYTATVEAVLATANAFMGSTFAGVARSALDLAVAYARERVQGGQPIIEHASVRSRLFKSFAKTEAACALSRHVATLNGVAAPPVQYSIASKTFCTTTAFEVASESLQILGGNGISREYPIEKVLRDARASMIEDGCNELLSIVGGAQL